MHYINHQPNRTLLTLTSIESNTKIYNRKFLIDFIFILSGLRILHYLTEISRISTDVFRHLFFDMDEYARRSSVDADKGQELDVQMDGVGPSEKRLHRTEYDTSPMTKILRKKIIQKLEDYFSFIEVKAQRNITLNLFVKEILYFSLDNFFFVALVVTMNFLVLFILFLLIDYVDLSMHQH